MAETIFSNLRVRGTLTAVGAFTAGVIAATTITATTGNFTTANVVTGEVATLSGTTINVLQPNGVINTLSREGTTISGTSIVALSPNGLIQGRTLSGAALFVTANRASGSVLCVRTTGVVGKCGSAPLASGLCTCNP